MSSRVFFREFGRFLKENRMIYFAFAVVGIALFGIIQFVETINIDKEAESIHIQENARMATFVFYVENTDQGVYTNSNFLDSVFLSSEFINGAERNTDIEISELIEKQLESGFVPTLLDRGYIGVGRNVHNETMQFQVKLGTEEENLAVANYYFDLLVNDEIPFLQNKTIYIVNEPYLVELSEENISASNQTSSDSSLPILILKGIIFAGGSLIVGILSMFLYHFFTNKINYAFSYEFDVSDTFFVIRKNNAEFESTIANPNYGKKLVLSQENFSDQVKLNMTGGKAENYYFSNQLILENPAEEFNEIVFIIVENQTDKEWYYKQREVLKNFSNPVKIIQIPPSMLATYQPKADVK